MVTVRSALPATIATLPRHQALAFLSLFFVPGASDSAHCRAARGPGPTRKCTGRDIALRGHGASRCNWALQHPLPVRRRFVFTIGAIALATSSSLLALNELRLLAVGVLSTFAFACIEITSQLYLLDHVPRHSLKHFEPIRIFARPWTVGPWLGVYLQGAIGFAAPFAVAACAGAILLVLFWSLRLGENATLATARRPPSNPVLYLRRFFAQPRLRLAWTLAASRSSWWSMFYVYAPIFAVTAGLGAEIGGVITSIGTGWIWLVPVWGWVGRRFGLRRHLLAGYAAAGTLSILAALSFCTPWLGATMLILAALGTETIDGAGNLLFLRAVHPYERAEITTAFASFRDVASLDLRWFAHCCYHSSAYPRSSLLLG